MPSAGYQISTTVPHVQDANDVKAHANWSPYDDNGGKHKDIYWFYDIDPTINQNPAIDTKMLHRFSWDAGRYGVGAVFTYDAVGSYERTGYASQGSGKELIQPVLDNQLKADSPLLLPARNSVTQLPMDRALDLVKDAFLSAGERDIYTGDAVEIYIITKDGVQKDSMVLKKD